MHALVLTPVCSPCLIHYYVFQQSVIAVNTGNQKCYKLHSYLPPQDHDRKRAASSVFFLIRLLAIHTFKFFCHWEVKKEYMCFSKEKSKDTGNRMNPSSQGLKKSYHLFETGETLMTGHKFIFQRLKKIRLINEFSIVYLRPSESFCCAL